MVLLVLAAVATALVASTTVAKVPEFYLPSETTQWKDYYSPMGNNKCVLCGGGVCWRFLA